jgi:hypothetical protein
MGTNKEDRNRKIREAAIVQPKIGFEKAEQKRLVHSLVERV